MSLPPTVTRRVMRELADLKKSPPEGIRVSTSEDNMLDLTGIIQGPEGTPYAGGYFKVKFKFTEEFPAAPPKCWFITKIFHPNVSTSGEICVNTLKKDWKSSYGISHILVTVKCLLIYPNPESALDEEAGKLLLENYEDYCQRAKLITSVHATPRVKPAEFDSPQPASVASTSKIPSATRPTHTLPSSLTLPSSIPSIIPSITRKSASPAPTPQPLQASPENTSPSPAALASIPSTISLTDKDTASTLAVNVNNSKERHTSPSPLGTADANVSAGVPVAIHTKAVKRSAGGGATGAEKRKKALKRL